MLKCPYCHYDNEDGALFCEQCKSDLAGAVMTAAPAVAEAIPVAQADALPLEAIPTATPFVEEAPVTMPHEALPLASVEPVDVAPPAAPAESIPVAPPEAPTPPVAAVAAPVSPQPVPAAPPPPPAAPAAQPAPGGPALASGTQPRLLVLRGQKRNVEYPLYEGLNFIGRADEKPVDIDLEDQEPPDRIWCSRQHACISFENDQLGIEDLNSANGTYVNRTRVYPGQKRALAPNDIIQIGNVQLKVVV